MDVRLGIGAYVTRGPGRGRLGVPHLVESVIADDSITRCGRRLPDRKGTTLRYVTVATDVCQGCD